MNNKKKKEQVYSIVESLSKRKVSGWRSLEYLYSDELTIKMCFTKIDGPQEAFLQCSQRHSQEFFAETVKLLSKEKNYCNLLSVI